LGENWQDDYYIWDCAAGTGNLLAGLTNKYNIYASTLDQADVSVVHERIDHGAHLLKNHVFQFDFLNDDFTKLPQSLQDIINDEEKRKKLVIYINPPYAEASASDTINNTIKRHKAGISKNNTYTKYSKILGRGINEIFIQFLIRIYKEIPQCKIAEFSTLKILLGQNLTNFRDVFNPKLEKLFLVPGNTFDNVKGQFPIGFFIWNSEIYEKFDSIQADVYDKSINGINFIGNKRITATKSKNVILNWMQQYYDKDEKRIAYMVRGASDFQNNQIVFITLNPSKAVVDHSQTHDITKNNLIHNCIYFAVRKSFEATWLNNQDQFLYPNEGWETDVEFQNNCLVFTLFDGKNQVSSQMSNPLDTTRNNTNHWIPFTEYEVNAQAKFESAFMTDFMKGKIQPEIQNEDLFSNVCQPELVSGSPEMLKQVQHDKNKQVQHDKALVFSEEATAVFDAGRELWTYYHTHPSTSSGYATSSGYVESKPYNVNASLYDIREHFQGRNDKGRMNSKSNDARYMELISELRSKLAVLADKIKPKVFEYGFLKE
jgi:hypothetical protein